VNPGSLLWFLKQTWRMVFSSGVNNRIHIDDAIRFLRRIHFVA
jgi:hypothetical protein